MSDRVDFYFRQRVTEAELDLAFALLEKADRDLAADLNIYGVITGAVPAPHAPVPDLTIDLTAPARAYDNLGQRMFFGTGQTVDCAVDLVGIPTDVATVGNERWIGVYLRFKRQLSDPRTDGNSQQVFFRRDESFELVVRQAPEGAIGVAPKPALQADELLICDVRRRPGQTQIVGGDIDISRRQAFIFAQGTSVAVNTGTWNVLEPAAETAQAALDEVDAELREHFTGTSRRHAASAVDYAAHAFLGAGTVQGAIDRLIDELASTTSGTPGAARVGADVIPGSPNALAAGTVDAQLSQLLGLLNAHLAAITGAHQASAIGATPHAYIAASSVQGQLQEVVTDLAATTAGASGASRIGGEAIAGAPNALGAATLRDQVATLLGFLNAHMTAVASAHAAAAIAATAHAYVGSPTVQGQLEEIVSDLQSQSASLGTAQIGSAAISGSPYSLAAGSARAQFAGALANLNAHTSSADHDARYYRRTDQVSDSDRVDGLHASAFALAGHDHDARYIRRVYQTSVTLNPNQATDLVTLADRPDFVTVSYNLVTNGVPEATTYVVGPLSSLVRCWVTKVNVGNNDKDYRITVHNTSTRQLYVSVAAYRSNA